MSDASRVYMFDGSDPQMLLAQDQAQSTFKYFWRELFWERRRIVPGLDLACVKTPFSDDWSNTTGDHSSKTEHMWVTDIEFDGEVISGTLMNSPNWLKSVKEGDHVRFPLKRLADWMYVFDGEVCGAYTVNVLRARMNHSDRREHDGMWGFDFGDPKKVKVLPTNEKEGLLKTWFGKKSPASNDHPMCTNMVPKVKEQIREDPSLVQNADEDGWTLLHHEALAGNGAIVQLLLEAGANRRAQTATGQIPLDLAKVLNWEHVIALLQ